MTRSEKLQALKYALYALLMLTAFVLCSARGVMPVLWGAVMNPLPFFVCAVALYDGPYAGAAFGVAAGLLSGLHSVAVEGLSSLYLGLYGLAFGLLALIWLRQIVLNALLGGFFCIVLQGLSRYVFYHGLVFGIPAGQSLQMMAGELLLAALPSLLLCFAVKKIYGKIEEVTNR